MKYGTHAIVCEMDGETKPLRTWCQLYAVNYQMVYDRLKRGIPLKEALTKPVQEKSDAEERKLDRMIQKKCKQCEWSEKDDARYICMYMVNCPKLQRRPVSVLDCVLEHEGSVFSPRKKGRLTPAQEAMFTSRRK